jgi:hypothetical protein
MYRNPWKCEYPPEWDYEVCPKCNNQFSERMAEENFKEITGGVWVCPDCFAEWENFYKGTEEDEE